MTHNTNSYAYPEGLGYLYPEGLGAISSSLWELTPKGSAVAADHAARGPTRRQFERLQNNLNRLAAQPNSGFGKIGNDGKIGKNTVAAVTAAEGFVGMSVVRGFPTHTVSDVATDADTAADAFGQAADQMGAPAKVSAPLSPKRAGGGDEIAIVSPETGRLTTIKEAGFGALLTSPLGLAALAVGGVLLWQATKKPRKKRRRKRKAARYKRRIITTWI